MATITTVSVVVPTLNEEAHIRGCLDSIRTQTFPPAEMEVIVVVGGESNDSTESIARSALEGSPFGKTLVVRNQESSTPSNLNLGLSHASGRFLCRVDARSRIAPEHVQRCVATLEERPEVAVVGGAQVAVPPTDSTIGLGIARALNNPLGMGGSRYRRNAESGECDTVYLGFFRRNEVASAGGWDDAFPTNQDFELNQRMRADGREIWFDKTIPATYIPRSSIRELYQQYQRFGRWKVRYWIRTGDRPQPRQLALLSAPLLSIGAGVGLRRISRTGVGRVLASVLAVTAAALVEGASTGPSRVPPAARVAHLTALAAVSIGWEVGVYREIGARRSRR